MKSLFICLASALLLTVGYGCFKTNEAKCVASSIAEDEVKIIDYTTSRGIFATKNSSGLYYRILNAGTGSTPSNSSKVFVKYTGRLTSDKIFDSTSDASKTGWTLGQLIEGWQIGLPLIKKGGSIQLFVPAALAYGCSQPGGIPANSILVFDIELVDVQ